ncbi:MULTISPECIES: hypothetical protein [Streptomyces]|uniref:hypothetical protein n=1 Tax=Streptomyces TaxID=1883 RepID=UPI000AB0F882|nr:MULTISPECIES: hypothetical protein [Streptomyces]MDI5907855.1 hypothetical protein [Streptomyces sp. 12257]
MLDRAAFPSLDAVFLGIVDEYHGARYSSGFPSPSRLELASTPTTRPELAAFLTHLDMEQLDDDEDDADTGGSDDERAGYDFRTERAVRHAEFIAVAEDFARSMSEGDIGWPPPLTSDAS